MESGMTKILKRRSTVLAGLLGICAVAALMATTVLATFGETASAQSSPTLSVTHAGWADDRTLSSDDQSDLGQSFTSPETSLSWDCSDRRCHSFDLEWSGIDPVNQDKGHSNQVDDADGWTITVTRLDDPITKVAEVEFVTGTSLVTSITQPVSVEEAGDTDDRSYLLGVPWAGERVRVTVTAGSVSASQKVTIPANHLPNAFTNRTDRAATVLVEHTETDNTLHSLVVVWPKVENATHYEVEYIFRNDLNQAEGKKFTNVSRIETGSQQQGLYRSLSPVWDSNHSNAAELNALTNANFDGAEADWIIVVGSLSKLLAGAEGWPEGSLDTANEIIEVIGEDGRNAVGVRVSPVLACGGFSDSHDKSELCSEGSHNARPLALKGRSSRVSYVRFDSSELPLHE